MDIKLRTKYNFAIFDLEGEITFDEIQDLEENLTIKIPEGYNKVIINLEMIIYIDSAFLGSLVKILKCLDKMKINLFLMNVSDEVLKVLTLTKFYKLFNYIKDEKALAKAQNSIELDEFLGNEQ